MNNRDKIVEFCEEYLEVDKFSDYCKNGLQIEGKQEVKKIITGVSLSDKFINLALEKKADLLLVHHGFFNDLIPQPLVVAGYIKNRLKKILAHDLNILGFHLPLDAHKEIGNNISICRGLGIKNVKKCSVGFVGDIEKAETFEKFVSRIDDFLETKSYIQQVNNREVKRVGVISGGASSEFEAVARMGADTFITGDIRENIVRGLEEVGLNFINAGHYNTEKLGIKNLGELVAKEFGVDVEFVDIPNEI